MLLHVLGLCLLALLTEGGRIAIQGKHFTKDGHNVFLSGANTAWVSYGYDFGNHQYAQRRAQFIHKMDMVHTAGGNSMRTWVHVHGSTSPKFDGSGHVTALDNDGTFISDFKQYLDDARTRGILVFPTLWNGAVVQDADKLKGLITDTGKLQSYLDHALTPWVNAVKDHPALGGWDIINEWEGFVKPGVHDNEPCFDSTHLQGTGAGWAGQLYSVHDILRFLNWQADAILRADPHALVTAGSWSQNSQTDNFGKFNYYKDTCLVKAGGKANGKLNFYSTHAYAWQGHFPQESVFQHSANDFGLDKPLVVAEFQEKDNSGGGMNDAQMFHYVYDHGYQGAWVWSDDTEAAQAAGIKALNHQNGAAGLVNFAL